jgi:membrane protease YdiL (CAAX protease family)
MGVSLSMVTLLFLFSYLLNPIQGQCVTVAIVLIVILLFGYLNRIGFKKNNTLKSLQYIAIVLIGALYSLVLSIVYVGQYEFHIPGTYRIVSIIFQMLSIAFFEEIFFRGILLNTIIYRFGGKKRGIYYAIIISSVLFGLAHLTNLINRPYLLMGTISQVVYATTIGMLYSTVYVKYKNIWSIIIIHALFNLTSIFPFTFLRINYWMITHYFLNLHNRPLIALFDIIITIPCFIYVLYLFKKLEINKIDNRVYCA